MLQETKKYQKGINLSKLVRLIAFNVEIPGFEEKWKTVIKMFLEKSFYKVFFTGSHFYSLLSWGNMGWMNLWLNY